MRDILTRAILYYLRFFAKISIFLNRPIIIGITGSAGKSSTRNAIYAVLKDKFKVKMIEKGNSETGIPLGVGGLKVESLGFETPLKSFFDWAGLLLQVPFKIFYLRKTKYLVVEMGVDDPYPPKNMEYLLTILKPEISVFLNVYPVHTMQFEKVVRNAISGKNIDDKKKKELILTAIAQEKGKIITQNDRCKIGIYNSDNRFVREVAKASKVKLLSFGKDSQNDISYKDYEINLSGTKFIFESKHANEKFEINLANYLLPRAYEQAIAAAYLVGQEVGLSVEQIRDGLRKYFNLPKGRSSILQGIRNTMIIDSSYNASRAPTLEFLNLMNLLKTKEKKPTVFLFGDMRELGEETKSEHEEVIEKIPGPIDYLFCVGPLTKKYVVPRLSKYLKEVKWFENSVEAGKYLENNLPEGAIVLVKGSQNTIFLEEAVKFILKDKKDIEKLCRQDSYWMNKKKYLYRD